MVDVFKNSFKHSIRNRLLDVEQIKTLAEEAEAIVNTRPLTYVTDDLDYYPLRPIDFLRPYAKLAGPYPQETDDEWTPVPTTRNALLAQWKATPQMLSHFWKRWTTEYLISLREHYKTEHKTPRSHEDGCPQLGDYVLIHDPVLNRGQWKMGKIVGSQDDFRRSVDIQLLSKKNHHETQQLGLQTGNISGYHPSATTRTSSTANSRFFASPNDHKIQGTTTFLFHPPMPHHLVLGPRHNGDQYTMPRRDKHKQNTPLCDYLHLKRNCHCKIRTHRNGSYVLVPHSLPNGTHTF
ncbi:hypothetical protein Y032_0220g2513 [Ancylostoma ceylanicum]|uniref:DUF5641 domain-containing protein n=1 Tax=Ancylostoma ceylanicum TaxID=53326 RepID=A0A016SI83_9BILA|nr:hypothetical protein Y032_0220g2513 [Ancylostoma ceylanicum]